MLRHAILVLLIVGSLTPAIAGDDRPVVAVREFFVRGSIEQNDAGKIVADLVRAELSKAFRVVPPRTMSGAPAARTIEFATIGQRGSAVARDLGASHLVIGRLSGLGKLVILEGAAIGAQDGSRPIRAMVTMSSIEQVPARIPDLVRALRLQPQRAPKPPKEAKAAQFPVKPPVAEPPAKSMPTVEDYTTKLSDPDSGVRFATVIDIAKRRDGRATPMLCQLLTTDGDLFVRRACARALAQVGDPDSVPWLIAALTDEETFVSMEAAKALNSITGRRMAVGPAPLEERQAWQREWQAWLEKKRAAERQKPEKSD